MIEIRPKKPEYAGMYIMRRLWGVDRRLNCFMWQAKEMRSNLYTFEAGGLSPPFRIISRQIWVVINRAIIPGRRVDPTSLKILIRPHVKGLIHFRLVGWDSHLDIYDQAHLHKSQRKCHFPFIGNDPRQEEWIGWMIGCYRRRLIMRWRKAISAVRSSHRRIVTKIETSVRCLIWISRGGVHSLWLSSNLL
jgi:hypothetical protein